jgi:hypothetical protein
MESLYLSALSDFLQHPVIDVRILDAKEVEALRAEVDKANGEASRARYLYSQEAARCLRYEDYLRSLGVNPASIK